ncbi:MAG TPA: NUDIX hydrolase [Patescibacteria group bacterium]|nr:NUDIX hydrolase [Patescibacteria group bacterium]
MQQRIRVAAIVIKNNKILLVKHVHPKTGYEWWVPPGGGIEEIDNSIFDCAKRETFEETNLQIETSKILYIREFYDKDNQKLNIEMFTLADSFEGELSMKNIAGNGQDEHFIKEIAWLSESELKDIVVYPEIIKDEFWKDCVVGFSNTKYLGRQI